ncbi:MAG: type I restriction enzyme HsdR N-terminal domain-containing protein [Proteobacteria bacterium]|nr:type I restriction enzyme HsdR N-terminal domain-containing protein [Pseudomonadota bacterium]
MDGHHLILGKTTDYITGEIIEDTHDERYRQKIARLLVNEKLYNKLDIKLRHELLVKAGEKKAIIRVDFLISMGNRICIIIKYGPGSIITRHRPALSASRLVASYQVPVVVVTNGVDADILDGSTGKVISNGLDAIPTKLELLKLSEKFIFSEIPETKIEAESRILYAYEVDGSCPCDETICRIDPEPQ